MRPRRAREAFWRWEQAWARRTRDMLGFGFGFGLEGGGRRGWIRIGGGGGEECFGELVGRSLAVGFNEERVLEV